MSLSTSSLSSWLFHHVCLQQIKDRKDDALKPTNPNAQKAVLSSANQYKVSPRPTAKMKPKSLHNLLNGGKVGVWLKLAYTVFTVDSMDVESF